MKDNDMKETLYPDVNIENELKNAKKEYNRLLGILARTVSKKYEIEGYSTDYMMGIDGVQVVFQQVGQYDKKLYNIKFDEIEGE